MVAVALAAWWVLIHHIQHSLRSRRVVSAAKAWLDTDPRQYLDRTAALMQEVITGIGHEQPGDSPSRRQAYADIRTAARWIALAIDAANRKRTADALRNPGEDPSVR